MERTRRAPSQGRALKTWGLRAGQLVLTALVTWFIVSRVGLGLDELRSLDAGVLRPRPLPLAASVLVLASGYFMSAGLWGRIVRDLGGPALGPRVSVPLFMVANLGRYVPGKVWQIASLGGGGGPPFANSISTPSSGRAATGFRSPWPPRPPSWGRGWRSSRPP
ncbi:MAG: hypothetical protein WD995_05655 [Gemmatimonadota bacterium]